MAVVSGVEVEVARRRFTVEEYHQMGEAGILHEDDRVELIEGEIIQMTPIGRRHAACVAELNRLLLRAVGERALLWPQNPILLSPHTELQPDIVLLRPRADRYIESEARPEDVLLLIEVSDTSQRYDRVVKLRLYARAGIREYWIVDLQGEVIEVYRQPEETRYAEARRVGRDGTVSPSAFPDITLAVEPILVLPSR